MERMIIKFFGVRGTLPVPGKDSLRYGGNTNCVTLEIGKQHFFIFDAGTGIKALSNYLVKHKKKSPIHAKIFISHPHYDHINGLPFFVPLYKAGNAFEFLGTNQETVCLEKMIADHMDNVYFPVTMEKFLAKVSFHELKEESFNIEDVSIKTIFLNHPGKCLGYRIEYGNKNFCYITDNELYFANHPKYSKAREQCLIDFINQTNMLVIDSTYSDKEYLIKKDWGHSCVSRVAEIAHAAQVKLLCLYHHDPDQLDDDIDAKLKHAKRILNSLRSKTECIAPREGDQIIL